MQTTKIRAKSLGLPDDKRIVAEYKRLLAQFDELPDKHLAFAQKLISRAAFLAVTIDDLEAEIVKNGYTEEYQNGANQRGVKKSPAAELHVTYSKNLFAVMKQLADLLPKPNEIEGEDEFDRF